MNRNITGVGAGRRILSFLKQKPNYFFDVKTVAEETNIKKPACYVYLHRLYYRREIERKGRGRYGYVSDVESFTAALQNEPIRYHNIHLICKNECNKSGGSPPAEKPDVKWEITEFEERTIKVALVSSRLKEIQFRCTNKPYTFEELDTTLELLFNHYGDIFARENWYFVTLDIAKDIENYHLDGIKELRYKDFMANYYIKIYNKGQDRVRTEVCASGKLWYKDVQNILHGTNTASQAILSKKVDSLTSAINSLARMYQRNLKYLDERGVI